LIDESGQTKDLPAQGWDPFRKDSAGK